MKKARNGFVKNLPYLCLAGVIVLGLMTIVGTGGDGGGGTTTPSPTTCENVAGTWTTTEVVNATDCGEGNYTDYETYIVTQNGCNITVTHSSGTYSGTVNGNQISWTGSWPEDGGTTTANISLTISADSLSGSSSWTWSDGTDSCSGTTQITGTRTGAPAAQCEDVAGTWTTTEVVNATACGEGTYTDYETYIITQNGCNITVTHSSGTYSGTVNGNQISWTGSYPEDGGTTTANISLTISADSLSGSSSWTWSDGTDSCSGTTQITGTRSVTPTPTTGSLKIINNTSKTITEVYFSPTTQATWGSNQLSGTISSGGGTWTLTDIPADDYDLKVVFSDSTTYVEWDISIVGGQTTTRTLT